MDLLRLTARIATSKYNPTKRYQIACIAKRADGTIVYSINHCEPNRQWAHHAEARVLRKCDVGATLYIARVLKRDRKEWALSSPCPRCRKLIEHKKIKEVFYTIAPNEYGCWKPGESTEVKRTIK